MTVRMKGSYVQSSKQTRLYLQEEKEKRTLEKKNRKEEHDNLERKKIQDTGRHEKIKGKQNGQASNNY